MIYGGKELSDLDLWALGDILKSLIDAETKREEASKHKKFKGMEFPPPNLEFLKLKAEVEAEIRKKQNV